VIPEREREIERICQAALECPHPEREAFLAKTCGGDGDLRREVERLLAHESAASGFLETPAVAAHGLSQPALQVGQQLGVYTILSSLGSGGMGEVYRARDATLGREVAIKALPPIFTGDAERLARFEREARLLAAVNHPHIATIHGVERLNGTHALVLELVEGKTLDEQIHRGPLAIDEALTIARQIADALEAAHEKGIIHRDLKPANIKIRPDGVVKVLDFGLAKAVAVEAPGPDLSDSPTVTIGGTHEGVLLGTAAYMSPEQARGKPVDKRADIWAFGSVLYEMLTGRAAFADETVSDTITAILGRDVDWSALPPTTPPGIRRLLKRCLEKDPKRRLHDIADARIEIEEAGASHVEDENIAHVPGLRVWRLAVVLLTAIAAAAIGWAVRPAPLLEEMRFEITTPPTTEPASLAISPDGRTIAFVGISDGKSLLWVRPLEAEAQSLAGTDNARHPFWSPDGQSIGFFAGSQLKRIERDGKGLLMLAPSGMGLGGTWTRDDTILLATSPDGIRRARATRPTPRVIDGEFGPDRAIPRVPGATGQAFPHLLPDGRHVLFSAIGTKRGIYVGRVGGPEPSRIVEAEAAVYTSGYLLFVREETLFAQPFDLSRFALGGTPIVVARQIVMRGGRAALAASPGGTIVYRTGQVKSQRELVWFDRSGKELNRVRGSENMGGLTSSLSPDGRRAALERIVDGTSDIWLLEVDRGVPTRFTFDPEYDQAPIWSPDSRRVLFQSRRKGPFALYVKGVDGKAGSEEVLLDTGTVKVPYDWSRDGRFVLYGETVRDIWALPLQGDRTPIPVAHTSFGESDAQFSPDGKWVAYTSDEAGQLDIYVQQFPDATRKRRVSPDGGVQARWRRDGRELFYLSLDHRLMAVPIRSEADSNELVIGTPDPLFSPRGGNSLTITTRSYSVSADGERFLMDVPTEVTMPVTVLLNWNPQRRRAP
jgi:serine/threonine protein kinase/Tol biopolymer transport system component